MRNIKKYWPAVIIAIIAIFVVALIVAKRPTAMTLFYGETCPHCQIVEEYLTANQVRARVQFQEREVYNNPANAQELTRRARQCGLDITQGVGVPFFFDGKNCLVGDQEIINFFKDK
ncbi:MAG: glutaredoxin domain-containing protein [Patescibacteria group bacterium]|jgi:glutaredoxin